MDFYTFLIAWLCALLGMTAFSALLAQLLKRELREHILLSQLVFTLKPIDENQTPQIWVGWVIHFVMGLVFMGLYEIAWLLTDLDRSFFWSTVFGIGMGIIGVLGWALMFKLHPKPPELHFKTFYIQLLGAHVVFSWIALLVFYLNA